MSNSHIIIVARNHRTGKIELPLEDLTLYGVGGEEDVLRTAARNYGPDWGLTLYRPYGDTHSGSKDVKLPTYRPRPRVG